jgi:predicted nuclease with RNAse H fold
VGVSLGVDVAEARKGLDLVVLDDGRRVVARHRRATVTDVAGVVREHRPDVVCVDSPPAWATSGRSRAAERGLRRLGITAYAVPEDPGPHPFYRWMRAGFAVFAAVADAYPRYRAGPVRGTAIEAFPEATAVLLAGHLRPTGEPKARFRRRVLAGQGIDTSDLPTLDAVDATLAALTGLLALEGELSAVGDPDEGVVVLPVRPLPAAPLRRPATWPVS